MKIKLNIKTNPLLKFALEAAVGAVLIVEVWALYILACMGG